MHLEHLYLLTVADINATNPRLWTDWKGSLMHNLYFETKRALQNGLGSPEQRSTWVTSAKRAVLERLEGMNVTQSEAKEVWHDVDDEFFLRERASDIAAFTAAIIANKDPDEPLVLLRDVGVEIPIATQIFVYARDREQIFSVIAAILEQLQLTIQDARLQTNSHNQAFDVFYVLDDEDRPVGQNTELCEKIIKALKKGIKNPKSVNPPIRRRTSRQLKQLTMKTTTSLQNDPDTNTTVLEVITPDRPGLLAHLGRIFLRYELNLYNAKIATLGERVEDVFYLTDRNHLPLTDPDFNLIIQQTICEELDQRNREETYGA